MHFGLQLVLANGNSVFLVDPTFDGYALLLVSYVTLIEHPHPPGTSRVKNKLPKRFVYGNVRFGRQCYPNFRNEVYSLLIRF